MGSGASSKFLAAKHKDVISHVAGSFEFFFICADKLRELPAEEGSRIPCHQEMLKLEGWLIKINVIFYILLKGGYENIAMISHRWVTPEHPDPRNEQLVKMQEFLADNPHIKMVWLDWGSIPQGRRHEDHESYFRESLNHVSLLYLCLPVCIIYDKQYGSRFWCNFEMYLSLRKPSTDGIGPADEELDSLFHFYCVGSARYNADELKAAELKNWAHRSAAEAAELLKEDDILVTNRRDKDIQLEKLIGLELRIKDILVKKESELNGMTQQRLKELEHSRSAAERLSKAKSEAVERETTLKVAQNALREAEKAVKEASEALRGVKLEIADIEQMVPWCEEMDEEVKALRTYLDLDTIATQNMWSSGAAFLAKLESGKYAAWGNMAYGANVTGVREMLDSDGVDQIWSSAEAFVAKLGSGKYVAWGAMANGADLTGVQDMLDSDGVDQIWSTGYAFVAKLGSGKYVAWGNKSHGADLTGVREMLESDGVDQIWSTCYAFVAKLGSGKYVAWGNKSHGADLTEVQEILHSHHVHQIWSSGHAFLAKLKSGKYVAWGLKSHGADLTGVQEMLDSDGADQIWSAGLAFLAKLKSGKYVAWGNMAYGANLTGVQDMLDSDGVDQIWSSLFAFVAKLGSGKYVGWGDKAHGADLTGVRELLESDGVDQIWSSYGAFVAKLGSGKYVAWGNKRHGADLRGVQEMLGSDFIVRWKPSTCHPAHIVMALSS